MPGKQMKKLQKPTWNPKTMAMSSKIFASIIQNCAVKVATWAEPFSRHIPLIGVHLRLGRLGIAYFTGAELQDWGSRLQWMLFVHNGICVWALCLYIVNTCDITLWHICCSYHHYTAFPNTAMALALAAWAATLNGQATAEDVKFLVETHISTPLLHQILGQMLKTRRSVRKQFWEFQLQKGKKQTWGKPKIIPARDPKQCVVRILKGKAERT